MSDNCFMVLPKMLAGVFCNYERIQPDGISYIYICSQITCGRQFSKHCCWRGNTGLLFRTYKVNWKLNTVRVEDL